MGLLLGASVMTICEFLDLFVYNGIAKCCKKKNHGSRVSTLHFPPEEKKEPL